ncbi:hypothetical protein NLJ89_g7834 [Agrocybe chaxingu]|uniref:Cytochrome P450 n=1 Tax=Agrocybe chaxingu TaxID=84603 RepID=A0A9W8MV28_9AGAR|nr:hypothetical protein NLJ89_g7834 [Agrocybe chaxingu]
MAEKYGGVVKLTGFLGDVQLYVFDPVAMHHIVLKVEMQSASSSAADNLLKDQNSYEEAESFMALIQVLFGGGLLGTSGERHKKQRKMLNPVFSIAHMREMVPTFYNVTHKLRDALLKKVEGGPQEAEMVSWMTRTALELIGQSGFGFSFDPLTEDSITHPYSEAAKRVVPLVFKMYISRTYLLPTLMKIGTPKLRRFFVDLLPWQHLHDIRDVVDVLRNTSVEILESKKKALAEGDDALARQIGQGKDILSILLKANMSASQGDRLSEAEVLSQITSLTFAAMDTTSSALSRTLWLLANNQDVQDRLRSELREARKQGDLAYDELSQIPYLDAICRETLRLYPPGPTVGRTTLQDSVLPLSSPIKGLDGKEIHELFIPKHTEITLSILSSNTNPEIWGPDSYEWKPERWLTSMPDTVTAAHIPGVYSHLMTFLGGGRSCIGFKFAQLEMKVVLSLLISSFKFSPSSKEIVWQMTEIVTPTTAGNETPTPELPLVVELAA